VTGEIRPFKWFKGCRKCGEKWMKSMFSHSTIGHTHWFQCFKCGELHIIVSNK